MKVLHHICLLLLAICLSGCHSPKEKAEIELRKRGIAPNIEAAIQYAAADRVDVLELLQKAGVPMGAVGKDGQTPLLAALEHGKNAIFPLLKMTPPDAIDFADKTGRTALGHAVEKGLNTFVAQLLNAGASPEKAGGTSVLNTLLERDGETLACRAIAKSHDNSPLFPSALGIAVQKNRLAAVRALLERNVSPDLVLPNGHALLYDAYARKQPEIVDALLAHGAKSPIPTAEMDNILNLALQNKDLPAIGRFLALGANPQTAGYDGKSPLEFAISAGDLPMLELFLKHGAKGSAYIRQIIAAGQLPIMELLLKYGFDVNQVNGDGDHPLHLAIRLKNVDFTRLLLEKGSAMDALGREGQTAFSMSVASGKIELVQLFLERGYDANTPFLSPPSPAFLATTGSPYFNKWLLKDEGFTPLMLAAARGEVPLIQTLLKAGAKRGQMSKNWGRYAVNFACNTEHIPAAQLLLGRDLEKPRDTWVYISLSQQKAMVYRNGEVVRTTQISTGKPGHATPPGTYVISDKQADWKSSIYKVPMPYFMRLSCLDFGLHQGNVVDHAASHGCIRLPKKIAAELFQLMAIGDPVFVQ